MTTFADLDELRAAAGRHLGRSAWLVIDEARLKAFSLATSGPHITPRSRTSNVDADLVPLLCLALIARFYNEVVQVRGHSYSLNYGLDGARLAPSLAVGSYVRGECLLLRVRDVAQCVDATMRWTVVARGQERPVCVADAVTRYYA